MNPADLGLPPKFAVFRKAQFDTALDICSSDKRFVIVSAPTGSGKSIIYMTVAQLLQARAMVVTSNKGLQEQLSRDFGTMGLVDVRGQANYRCRVISTEKVRKGCDEGPCHHGQFCEFHPRAMETGEFVPGCEWFDALARARKSRLVVTNYDLWMSVLRYMDPLVLGVFDMLILDEAHDAPDKLSEFCSVTINAEECDEWLNSGLPPVEDGVESWVSWANFHKPGLQALLETMRHGGGADASLRQLQNFTGRVTFLSQAHGWERADQTEPAVQIAGIQTDWVAERASDGQSVGFSPVWAHRYAEKFLFGGIKRVVLMSATIMRQTAKYVGIPDDQMQFIEQVSSFHPERRPVYSIQTASIGRNSTQADFRALSTRIDQIISGRLDRKGIILTPSYDLAYNLRMGSGFRSSIRYHRKGVLGLQDIESWRQDRNPSVMISPILHQGWDFPYEQCEYLIIPKVPFVDDRPMVMQARKRSDKTYLNYVATLKLQQQSGRGMRAEDDQCEIFILDDNFSRWFYFASKKIFSAWFKQAVKFVDVIPPPLPKLRRQANFTH